MGLGVVLASVLVRSTEGGMACVIISLSKVGVASVLVLLSKGGGLFVSGSMNFMPVGSCKLF